MMERNQESLSTRDLASPNDPAPAAGASPEPVDEGSASGGAPVQVVDQTQTAPAPAQPDSDLPQTQADTSPQPAPTDTGPQPAPIDTGPAPAPTDTGPAPAPIDTGPAPAPTDTGPAPAATDSGPAPAPTDTGLPGASSQSTLTPAETDAAPTQSNEPLLAADSSATFQRQWEEVQTRFVDDPRGAVEDADRLVANVMQQLAEGFAQAREGLEAHWGRGEDISTEELRVSMQRYRSFFQRLLST